MFHWNEVGMQEELRDITTLHNVYNKHELIEQWNCSFFSLQAMTKIKFKEFTLFGKMFLKTELF